MLAVEEDDEDCTAGLECVELLCEAPLPTPNDDDGDAFDTGIKPGELEGCLAWELALERVVGG
jgi:hypothetical protein